MRAYDIIYKKRQGEELSTEEINYLINGYSNDSIPDYQLSAWSMAVFYKGMTSKETADLTMAMVDSGDTVNLSSIQGIKVDKHSSGGVGDTTTLILAPLVSAAGVPVAKLSGRGLGHTGGTIDKLESIPGFNTDLSLDEFINNVNQVGVAVAGQTADLTPADKKLYSLRDVTATVDSIPLIASSIMSKKIAGGADGIVLDVKMGDGAFMENLEDARELAKAMVNIGKELGRKTIAVITNMDQPLGHAIGNVLEVKEAINTLKGEGPEDLTELCLTLGANMLVIAEKAENYDEGYRNLKNILNSGKGLDQFEKFIQAQGGDSKIVSNTEILPEADHILTVKAEQRGYVSKIMTKELGLLAVEIGAGRAKKGEDIDPAVGIVVHKKIGDYVKRGEKLAVIHLNSLIDKEKIMSKVHKAFLIDTVDIKTPKLIYDIIK